MLLWTPSKFMTIPAYLRKQALESAKNTNVSPFLSQVVKVPCVSFTFCIFLLQLYSGRLNPQFLWPLAHLGATP